MPAKIEREGVISVFDFFQMFPDEDSAREYIEKIRWENGVCCPHCDCEDLKKLRRVPKRRRVTKAQTQGLLLLQVVQGAVHGANRDHFPAVAYSAQQVAVCNLHVGDSAQRDQQHTVGKGGGHNAKISMVHVAQAA